MQKYNHSKIEKKWQKYWEIKKTFLAKDFSKKPKKYVLAEFPYPSGTGLHMGHLRPYVAADVYARFNRALGFETLFPMGWDAFGLPAENYAIKIGVHPSKAIAQNIKNAKRQLQSWGISFDWSREINTTDPNYYKWTQWLFLQFYKAGLAYEATGLINWCPKDKTGLANEEVINGKCERCGTIVEKKELRQWYLKITAYAEKLLEGLKNLPEWPEAVKLQQKNWIAKSVGAEIEFGIGIEKSKGRNYVLLHGFSATPKENYHAWLKNELELKGYTVTVPVLPNTKKPTEEEQVNFVLRNCKFNKNTILVGHSLGAVVAMKVLEKLDTSIGGLVLVGGFVSPNFKDHDRNFARNFNWNFDFEKIKNRANGNVQILHDPHDVAVMDDSAAALSEAFNVPITFCNPNETHFCGTEEPEVLKALALSIKVFTTRPDTIFGATYLVVAPEHGMISNLKSQITNWDQVLQYIEKAKAEAEIDRAAEGKEKTGVELRGVMAVNPATREEISVWVADYVLGGYGTGAIMAVPAHDERDFEFAKKFNLPVKNVIFPLHGGVSTFVSGNQVFDSTTAIADRESGILNGLRVYTGEGPLRNSGKFDGMQSTEAVPKLAAVYGKPTTQYKLRDWVFSRQRYWGEPIPIIHCEKCGIVPVPEKDLPVQLPPVKKYEPTGTGESPLAAIKKWVNVKCPKCKGPAKRETNTMPNWAGSSWYWLRYTDPKNKKTFADKKKQKYWTPVDVYFGGMEHTTLHLLYSRFWNLFLYDQKLVMGKEPYKLRKPHGIILGPDGEKMSKSRGNVVNPDEVVESFGADTLRMFELFLGPHEATVPWNDQGSIGIRRFLERVWNWTNEAKGKSIKSKVGDSEKVVRAINRLTKKITEDIENFHFNTAISSFMEFYNQVKDEPISDGSRKVFLKLLYPFAPHITEELYQLLGGKKSLQMEAWPKYDKSKLAELTVEIVVQVNGKVKGKITVPTGSNQKLVQAAVLEIEQVKNVAVLESIKRVIFIPNKLINLVI